MECFTIFVMAKCWLNATESKPHNISKIHQPSLTYIQLNKKPKKLL